MAGARRRTRRLSPVDTAWLRIEHPTNLMLVTAVLLFEQPLDFARLQQVLESRLLRFERFRQRLRESRLPLRLPGWEADPGFDLQAHLRRLTLPDPGDQAVLQRLVSDLMSTPLDLSRPLWQIHLIENYAGGCALLARLHHSIADGIALIQLLLSLADNAPAAPPEQPDQPRSRSSSLAGAGATGLAKIGRAARSALADPGRLLRMLRRNAAAFNKLMRMPSDPITLLKGELGVAKQAVWSAPLSLDLIRSIGREAGATANDVLVAAAGGALRRYLLEHGQPVDGLSIRALVPVNLRPREQARQLGNHFGLVFLPLPIGIANPRERLATLKKQMDSIKRTPEARIAYRLLNLVGLAPAALQRRIGNYYGRMATIVMTNVPGPRRPLYLAGLPIKSMMFWVPQASRLGIGVSILSYAGEVRLGIAVDAGLIPDPQMILDGFSAEVEQLAVLSGVSGAADDDAADFQRCSALSKAGRRCKNRVVGATGLCRVHLPGS